MNILLIIKLLKQVNILKTIYFNLHYFSFNTAIRLPFLIYWRTKLYKMNGNIIINSPIHIGMVRIGPHGLGTQDMFYSRTIWEMNGTLTISGGGNITIGRGCRISVCRDANLTLGANFHITGNTTLYCEKEITFGNDCLLSWDILIMDTDSHDIIDKNGEKINYPKRIRIGDHVWIGCRNTILKGVEIGNNCIVSANSTVTKSVVEENCVIGGHGKSLEVIKRDVEWKQ